MPAVVRRKGGNHLLAIESKKSAQKENKKSGRLHGICKAFAAKFSRSLKVKNNPINS